MRENRLVISLSLGMERIALAGRLPVGFISTG